jgi:hypothetical protein
MDILIILNNFNMNTLSPILLLIIIIYITNQLHITIDILFNHKYYNKDLCK